MTCINGVKKAAEGVLTSDEVDLLVKELQRRAEQRKQNALNTPNQDAAELSKQIKHAAFIEKRNFALNILAEKRFDAHLEKFKANPYKGFVSFLTGVTSRKERSRASIGARIDAVHGELVGGLISELRKADLLPVLNKRELDLSIAQEMWELGRTGGKPGISGNEQAKQIAEIFHKYQDVAVRQQNSLGADIGKIEGYIVRQSHDLFRIRKAGFDKWKESILPKLDQKETFKDVDNIDEYLKKVFVNLASGEHFTVDGAGTAGKLGFTGPANLAKKVSAERSLHFKDAESWHAYNQDFGTGNLTESVFFGLHRSAKNIGLMEGLGPNPRAMFEKLHGKYLEQFRGDIKLHDKLKSNQLLYIMDQLDGTANIPGNPTGAKISAGIRALQSMAKLGMATISSLADIPTQAATLTNNGIGFFNAYKSAIGNVTTGFKSKELKHVADLIGAGLDGLLGGVMARIDGNDTVPGVLSKMMQRYFKANLLTQWTDAHKSGIGIMLARNLDLNKHLPFDKLDKDLKNVLNQYFTSKEWDVIRQGTSMKADGKTYLTPDSIRDIPDNVIKSVFGEMSDKSVEITKQKLERDLRSYYLDQVNEGVPTPGARENAILRQGTKPGTYLGEAMRFIGQFKAFPVTFGNKVLGKNFPGDAVWYKQLVNGEADILGLSHLIVGTTVAGYISMNMKDILKGKQPREITDIKSAGKVFAASMIQGGGLGIYGDFIFGEANRFGRSSLDTFLGPTFGTAADTKDVLTSIATGQKFGNKAFNLAKSNLPFMNLFYTKMGMDYLILNNIQESINPGYLKRMEDRIKKENNQEFWLSPTKVNREGF